MGLIEFFPDTAGPPKALNGFLPTPFYGQCAFNTTFLCTVNIHNDTYIYIYILDLGPMLKSIKLKQLLSWISLWVPTTWLVDRSPPKLPIKPLWKQFLHGPLWDPFAIHSQKEWEPKRTIKHYDTSKRKAHVWQVLTRVFFVPMPFLPCLTSTTSGPNSSCSMATSGLAVSQADSEAYLPPHWLEPYKQYTHVFWICSLLRCLSVYIYTFSNSLAYAQLYIYTYELHQ
jgi:hypothetical protein